MKKGLDLGKDVLRCIFKLLPVKAVVALRATSVKLRELGQEALLWNALTLRDYGVEGGEDVYKEEYEHQDTTLWYTSRWATLATPCLIREGDFFEEPPDIHEGTLFARNHLRTCIIIGIVSSVKCYLRREIYPKWLLLAALKCATYTNFIYLILNDRRVDPRECATRLLHFAIDRNDTKLMSTLLNKHKVDPFYVTRYPPKTMEMLDIVLERDIPIVDLKTMLHRAATRYKNFEVVQRLLRVDGIDAF